MAKNVLRMLFVFNLSCSVALFIYGTLTSDDRFFVVSVGHICLCSVLVFPVWTRSNVSYLEPYFFFVMYTLIGTLCTSYIIAFHDSFRRDTIMNGYPVGFFASQGVFLAVALLLMGLGYVSCKSRIKIENYMPNEARFTHGGLHRAGLIVLICSIASLVAFLQSTGGLDFSQLSKKRAIEVASGGEIVYGNAAYLRLGVSTSMSMLYVYIAYCMRTDGKIGPSGFLFSLPFFLTGAALPFLSSSRGDVAYSLIGLLVVYGAYKRVSVVSIGVLGLVAMSAFGLMTAMRFSDQQGTTEKFINPIIALAESGNGLSLSGTTIIMDGVPERLNYKLGTTYFTWLVAPIPRTVWLGKPEISLGKEIKTEIYGQKAVKSGRPPGVLGEGYINFGIIGFLASAFVVGFLFRLVANSFLPVLTSNLIVIALYYPIILNLSALANNGVSQIIVRLLSDAIPVFLLIFAAQIFSRRGRGSVSNAKL